jgi:putative methionine-R-sulfoxide reductase with GAF domain
MPLAHDMAGVSAWAEALTVAIEADHQFQQVSVLIHDADANGLRLVTQRWAGNGDLGLLVPGQWVVPLVGSICGRVFRTGIPALVSDVALDPDYLSFSGGRTKSELAVPIVVEVTTVGVVNIEAPFVSAFGIADLELVRGRIEVAVRTFPVAVGDEAD